jgi:hypothetical protein
MCIACTEWIKDRLTLKEFRSALRETTRDDQRHFEEVDQVLAETGEDSNLAKEALKKILK